jgi:hypothetical protein
MDAGSGETLPWRSILPCSWGQEAPSGSHQASPELSSHSSSFPSARTSLILHSVSSTSSESSSSCLLLLALDPVWRGWLAGSLDAEEGASSCLGLLLWGQQGNPVSILQVWPSGHNDAVKSCLTCSITGCR